MSFKWYLVAFRLRPTDHHWPKNNNARVTTDTTFATVHQNPHSKKERGLNESPWIKIYNKRDDKALLQILNLNIKQFQTLHDVFRSWHDARIAGPLFELLDDDTPAPFYTVGDSAFPKHGKK
eukprot:g42190.t1